MTFGRAWRRIARQPGMMIVFGVVKVQAGLAGQITSLGSARFGPMLSVPRFGADSGAPVVLIFSAEY